MAPIIEFFELTYQRESVANLGDMDLMSSEPFVNMYIRNLILPQIQNFKVMDL